jgi:CubicO group peptidase (beta-lactamase class C family)
LCTKIIDLEKLQHTQNKFMYFVLAIPFFCHIFKNGTKLVWMKGRINLFANSKKLLASLFTHYFLSLSMLLRVSLMTLMGVLLTLHANNRLPLAKNLMHTNLTANQLCQQQYRHRLIDSMMQDLAMHRNFRGVMLVAENGEQVYKKAFGYVRKDTLQPFDTTYTMQLASVSKPFTAVAVLQLIEKGLLNYDDDIKKWFPKLRYKGITIHHLLQHTSGLPDYINDNYLFIKYAKNKGKGIIWTNQDLINVLEKQKINLRFSTGKKFSYSNTGYALLATIIEKVSQKSYPKYMKENIFLPLGMVHTFVYQTSMEHIETIREDYREGIMGAKGIYSTVDDMLRFDQALYNSKLLKISTLDSAFRQGSTTEQERFDYGFGWRLRSTELGDRIVYHRGLWEDANPMFIRFVECNRTIISLHHPTSSDHWGFIEAIQQVMNESQTVCAGF